MTPLKRHLYALITMGALILTCVDVGSDGVVVEPVTFQVHGPFTLPVRRFCGGSVSCDL